MQMHKSKERILKYLTLSIVAALEVVGILVASGYFQRLREPPIHYNVQSSSEQNSLQVLNFSGDLRGNAPASRCTSNVFYTSLPAKCRDADGKLIQVHEMSPNLIVIPEDK